MLKSLDGRTKLCNYVCALLTLCLLIFQFTPFWNFGSDSLSINGYVWLDTSNTEIANWFTSQLGSAVNINSIVLTSVLVLLFGAAGLVLCLMKSDIGLVALLPAVSALSGIYAFVLKPVFRLGSTWIIQLIICIAILAFAVMAIVFGRQKNEQKVSGKKVLSQGDINARVAAIKALGEKSAKKTKGEDTDSNFHKLLTYLTDEVPECRIAAAEELGKTSRDVAFTHISHLLGSETDERVIKTMRTSLVSIRENIRLEHSANA